MALTFSNSTGNKILTYIDIIPYVESNLSALSYHMICKWEDQSTSQVGLAIFRVGFNTTHFLTLSKMSYNININDFLRFSYDDGWIYIVWKEDDGTLSMSQIGARSLSPNTYIKLKMPTYDEIWAAIIEDGPTNDYIYYLSNNKLTFLGQSWTKHPNWCTDYISESVNATELGASDINISFSLLSMFTQVSVDLSSSTTKYNDSSTDPSHNDFTQFDCARITNNLTDDVLTTITVNKNSSQVSNNVISYFQNDYNYSCPLNTSNGVDFTNPILNTTLTFENGTIVPWAIINILTGQIVITNISINTYEDQVKLVVNAYNNDDLNATGYLVVNIVNLPPYNTTSLTNFTIVAGGSNQTYNVSGLFSDHEAEPFTLTSDTSNSDCIEFSNDVFTIVPTNWSSN